MITLEHDCMSGLKNDTWNLTAAEATDFIATLLQDLTVIRPVLSIPAFLGDRGYIIRLSGLDATVLGLLGIPLEFRITNLPLDLSYLDLDLLAPIAPGDQEPATTSDAEELPDELDSGGGGQSVALAKALAACSLAYTSWNDFSFWNGTRQPNNNCYCYAANYATNDWSHPGRKGGRPLPYYNDLSYRPTAARFTDALLADGWKTTCNGSSLRIVAVLGTFKYNGTPYIWDYHFYRKNLNGTTTRFCHKPGDGPVTNKDGSGHYITSVSTADRSTPIGGGVVSDYSQIVGTFYSPAGSRSHKIS